MSRSSLRKLRASMNLPYTLLFKGQHKKVVPQARHLLLITLAHNDVGHHGVYATTALLTERYWWPHMTQDFAWFILTCHICQVRKMKQSLIPPVVDVPAPLFSKVYMDTMHMPPSSGPLTALTYISPGFVRALVETEMPGASGSVFRTRIDL